MKILYTKKSCSRCLQVKALDDFQRDRASADERRSQCRACVTERAAMRYSTVFSGLRGPLFRPGRFRDYREPYEQEMNPAEKERLRELAWEKKRIEQLHHSYVAELLSRGAHVPASEIPPPLIEAKRAHLKIKRLLKEMNRHENAQRN